MRVSSGLGWAVVAIAALLLFSTAFQAVGQQNPEPKKEASAAAYVGSDACLTCHKSVATAWATNPHGKAPAAEGLGDNLKGCEACHGPGSAHIADPSAVKPINPAAIPAKEINAICGKCHFEGEPGAKTKTIQSKHWARSEHNRGDVSCLACHTAHSTAPKLVKKESPELCATCHQDVVKKGDYQHAPVASGACLNCHNPHGSNARHHLISDVSKLCATCHNPKAEKLTTAHHGLDLTNSDCTECHSAHSRDKAGKLIKAKQHTPFKSGRCETCHKPNSIELAKPQKELCTMCHSKDLAQAPTDGAHMHAPVGEGLCTACHSAHASDAPKGLWKDKTVAYSCFMCHNKVETAMTGSAHAHKPAASLNCQTCHAPHTSKEKSLLTKDSIELCKGCHEPHGHPFGKTPDGKVVINPVTNDMLTCASCHEPHGSDFDKLTIKDKSTELCVMCHKV